MMRRHALPADWWTMDYDTFLRSRRPLIVNIIRDGFSRLGTGEQAAQAADGARALA